MTDMSDSGYDPASLPDLLPIYYKKLFPYGPYFKWLSYGGAPKSYFTNREFSFTLKDDVYIRYQSFSDKQEMEKEIQKRCPYKIDIGAVFSHRPKDHKTVKAAAFQAQEKELVFDIDMTDYDDVRSCCSGGYREDVDDIWKCVIGQGYLRQGSGADICSLCWPLMQIAIKIIDRSLRDDFGFRHMLWVYSGRRGVHCWVCDEVARKLSAQGRSAIAEYLSVVKGGEQQTKKVTLDDPIHPSIRHSIDIVRQRFHDYAIKRQDFLGDEEKQNKVLALVPDDELRSRLQEDFEMGNNSNNWWAIIEKRVRDFVSKRSSKSSTHNVEEIMLQYCYPRLDVNVSKGVNHLLKSPFCIHPKTGRVCVPIDIDHVEDFDPMAVPTISQILDELNQTSTNTEESGKKIKEYKKTSMGDCLKIFDKFLKSLETTWAGKVLKESDENKEF